MQYRLEAFLGVAVLVGIQVGAFLREWFAAVEAMPGAGARSC